jgi:hypothetical protein
VVHAAARAGGGARCNFVEKPGRDELDIGHATSVAPRRCDNVLR